MNVLQELMQISKYCRKPQKASVHFHQLSFGLSGTSKFGKSDDVSSSPDIWCQPYCFESLKIIIHSKSNHMTLTYLWETMDIFGYISLTAD